MGFHIEGSVAVVTGAASGIGLAIARSLATRGASVVLSDLDGERLAEALASVSGTGAMAECCDVRSEAEMDALARRVVERHGRIDLLINNAGVGLGGPVEAIALVDWEWAIDINVLGVVRGIRAFLPQMLAQGTGHIVNTASSVALFADAPQAIPYVTTKYAVMGLSRALAEYLRPRGIGVTVLCPDSTATAFRSSAKVVGADLSAVVATLPPMPVQSAEYVAEALIEGLRNNRFLVSLTPGARERMIAETGAMF
jgi:NAD(P)-dependent dehydrogenase (short-subunit alcohol dehydrogenase family)